MKKETLNKVLITIGTMFIVVFIYLIFLRPNFKYIGENKAFQFTNKDEGEEEKFINKTYKQCKNICYGFDFLKVIGALFGVKSKCVGFSHEFDYKNNNKKGQCVLYNNKNNKKRIEFSEVNKYDEGYNYLYKFRNGVFG